MATGFFFSREESWLHGSSFMGQVTDILGRIFSEPPHRYHHHSSGILFNYQSDCSAEHQQKTARSMGREGRVDTTVRLSVTGTVVSCMVPVPQ